MPGACGVGHRRPLALDASSGRVAAVAASHRER